MTHRSGLSILEMVIAILILTTATVVVMEAMTSSQRYAEAGEAQDDLSTGGMRILRSIASDLNGSGWLIPEVTLGVSASLTTNESDDRTARYFPYVLSQRSGSSLQTSGTLSYLNRAASLIIDPTDLARRTTRLASPAAPIGGTIFPAVLPTGEPGKMYDSSKSLWSTTSATQATMYYDSFFAASQEFVFTRAATHPSTWRADPRQPDQGRLLRSFNGTRSQWSATASASLGPNSAAHTALGILYPSAWRETSPGSGTFEPIEDADGNGLPDQPYGRPMETAVLDPSNLTLNVYWETVATPSYDPQFPMSTQAAIDAIREYHYAVVPSRLGLGRLVRAMKIARTITPVTTIPEIGDCIASNGSGSSMVVDQVLSDDVVRIVFDTYRTTGALGQLGVDQVRVRLYMAKASSGRFGRATVISHVVDTTLTMRAKNSDPLRSIDATQLGASGLTYATR